MARRLSIKHRKTARDIATARKNGIEKKQHKVAVERSEKAKYKKNSRA